MKDDLRDVLGKAAYEAVIPFLDEAPDELKKTWEALEDRIRLSYCLEAEAVVNKLAEMLVPPVVYALLSPEQIAAIVRSMQ